MQNLISEKIDKDEKYDALVEDVPEFLIDLSMYIPKFLNDLWEEPKLIAKILMKADNIEVKKILAPFICNNFYQNIISPYSIEENLLYVISLMLKEEINNLDSITQVNNFLKNTPCGYL